MPADFSSCHGVVHIDAYGNPVERANGILAKGFIKKDPTNLIARATD